MERRLPARSRSSLAGRSATSIGPATSRHHQRRLRRLRSRSVNVAPRRRTIRDTSPRWSPDGTRLAFLSERAPKEKLQLYVMPADGGEPTRLTSLENGASSIAWSPDGARLAFVSPVDGQREPESEEERRKSRPARVITSLKYRFNGEGFVYDRRPHVFVVALDGTAPRPVTDGDFIDARNHAGTNCFEDFNGPESEQHSKNSTDHGDEQRLGHQQTDDPPARAPDREAYRNFPLARGCASECQISDVRARDQQKENCAGCCNQQSFAVFADEIAQ